MFVYIFNYSRISKLQSIFSNPATALSTKFRSCSKFFVVISTIFRASSLGVNSLLRNHFFLLIQKKQFLIHSSFIMRLQQFSHILRLHLEFQFSCYFCHICSYFLHWSLEKLKVIHRVGINFFQTPVVFWWWERWYFDLFLWIMNVFNGIPTSRMVNLFYTSFN